MPDVLSLPDGATPGCASAEFEQHCKRLADLVAHAAAGICQTDLNGRILLANACFGRIVGRAEAALLGTSVQDLADPEDLPADLALVERLIAGGAPETREERYLRPDGTSVWVSREVAAVRDPAGRPHALVAVVRDITERKQAEARLRESEEFARSVIESSLDGIAVLDLDGRLQFMNGAARRLLEIDDFAAFAGRPWTALFPCEPAAEAGQAVASARAGVPAHFVSCAPTAKGTAKWWDTTVSPVVGAGGAVVRLLAISRDVTERRQVEQQIAHLQHHDPLTGLANRGSFRRQLEQVLGRLERGRRVAMYRLDIDQFKSVNDLLGYPAGDKVLRQVAGRLREQVRDHGVIARLDGDEFVILQPDVGAPDEAAGFAERIIEAVGKPYQVDGEQVVLGCSVGVALAPDNGSAPDEIANRADAALYRAKARDRGRYCLFDARVDEAIRRKQALRAGLSVALVRGELTLDFQPLVRLADGEITCFEALMRWRHPRRGPVPPADFVPVAEDAGLIVPIGEWALRAACREAASWPARVRVAVNISPVQFRAGLPGAVADALAESGLSPERLELEVTESVLLQEDETNLALLHKLREAGVRIALDDFGTGYSSLGYLRRLPFDKIKIDRSFVAEITRREESLAIVRAVAGLGRSLGITVTAEGVENERQLAALLGEGCGEGQGHFFSPPVTAAEVPGVIRALQDCRGVPSLFDRSLLD
jgi:diguanylate cyclase (GGDEF)-like protein/PAS domain S-box-containing protein